MTDTRLRELERRFKESGAPEDELAYLQERVRQGERLDWDSYSRLGELNVEAASEYLLVRVERGELEQEKLELAAYCSHEPAQAALGSSAVKAIQEKGQTQALAALKGAAADAGQAQAAVVLDHASKATELELFVVGLSVWGLTPCAVAASATTRAVLDVWERALPDDSRPREALAALEQWIAEPSAETARGAWLAAQGAAAAASSQRPVSPQLAEAGYIAACSALVAGWTLSDERKSARSAGLAVFGAESKGLIEAGGFLTSSRQRLTSWALAWQPGS